MALDDKPKLPPHQLGGIWPLPHRAEAKVIIDAQSARIAELEGLLRHKASRGDAEAERMLGTAPNPWRPGGPVDVKVTAGGGSSGPSSSTHGVSGGAGSTTQAFPDEITIAGVPYRRTGRNTYEPR